MLIKLDGDFKILLDDQLDELYFLNLLISTVRIKLLTMVQDDELPPAIIAFIKKHDIRQVINSTRQLRKFIFHKSGNSSLMRTANIDYFKFLKELNILLRKHVK